MLTVDRILLIEAIIQLRAEISMFLAQGAACPVTLQEPLRLAFSTSLNYNIVDRRERHGAPSRGRTCEP
jgi:hypothetical protein